MIPRRNCMKTVGVKNCACRVYLGAIKTLTVFTHFLLELIEFQFTEPNRELSLVSKILSWPMG